MRFVPVMSLQEGMVLGRDIITDSDAFLLTKGMTLVARHLEYLAEKGYMGAYIRDTFSADLEIEDTINPKLFKEGLRVVREENVEGILSVATGIVLDVTQKRDISVDLLDLRSYDDYTYHHSVNVAVFATAVGKRMGLNAKDLQLLTLAALTHDLGKSKIDESILNKPGKLTDEEYELVKGHARESFDMLANKVEIPAVVRQAVLMHHENENGSGYPFGKEGNSIPLFAKIIHGVDVYDALTTKRPYKEPYAPSDAISYLESGTGILFDERVVLAIKAVIPAYPPGIDVTLSNGEKGLVIAHTDNALRPVIKLLNGRKVDLSKADDYLEVAIVASGIMPQDYVGEIESLNENRSAVKPQRARVMVVDDDPLSLMFVRNTLSYYCDVVPVKSGTAALSLLERNGQPELIILDVDMPIISGLEVARAIRKKGYTVPIIFLTGTASKEMVIKCRSVGCVDYIVKPTNKIYLIERVNVALSNQQER